MPHGNPIDWRGGATENAVVVGDITASPSKYLTFSIREGQTPTTVAQNLANAWNDQHGEHGAATVDGKGQVTLPGNVDQTRLTTFSKGAIVIQDVPNHPRSATVAGLTVFSPAQEHH